MLYLGLVQHVALDFLFTASRIENLFFQLGVDDEFHADLLGELLLLLVVLAFFELREELFDLAMVALEQGYRVGFAFRTGAFRRAGICIFHWASPLSVC